MSQKKYKDKEKNTGEKGEDQEILSSDRKTKVSGIIGAKRTVKRTNKHSKNGQN